MWIIREGTAIAGLQEPYLLMFIPSVLLSHIELRLAYMINRIWQEWWYLMSKFGHKRYFSFCLTFGISHARGIQLPSHEDMPAALWRAPIFQKLTLMTNCQQWWGNHPESGSPTSSQAFRWLHLWLTPDCKCIKDPKRCPDEAFPKVEHTENRRGNKLSLLFEPLSFEIICYTAIVACTEYQMN